MNGLYTEKSICLMRAAVFVASLAFIALGTMREEHLVVLKLSSKVANIKWYLLTTLYNSLMTMSHYYQAEVQHDLYGGSPFHKV